MHRVASTLVVSVITASSLARPACRQSLRLALLFVVSACSGDAAGDQASGASILPSLGAKTVVSAGEVLIRPPSTPYSVANVAATGSVTGTVTLKGEPAQPTPVLTGRDSSLCGPAIPDGSVQVQGSGLAGVVVWIEGVRRGKAPGLERRLELESAHCVLTPRVQAAVVQSAVNILGHDEFRQHLRFVAGNESAPRATILLGGGEQVIPTELPFKTAGMVSVRDPEHPWTRAYLAVFDHPYFAVTNAGGAFTIDGIPPGKYTLRTWHERVGVVDQPLEIGTSGPVKVNVVLEAK